MKPRPSSSPYMVYLMIFLHMLLSFLLVFIGVHYIVTLCIMSLKLFSAAICSMYMGIGTMDKFSCVSSKDLFQRYSYLTLLLFKLAAYSIHNGKGHCGFVAFLSGCMYVQYVCALIKVYCHFSYSFGSTLFFEVVCSAK